MKKFVLSFLLIVCVIATLAFVCFSNVKYNGNESKIELSSETGPFSEKNTKILSDYSDQRIIFIDYSKPSFQKRLWVLEGEKVLLNCHVSHGKESGFIFAESFSNEVGSNKSCLGNFRTSTVYQGEHGISMRVIGLDKDNSNTYSRSIVFHSANYATTNYLLTHGYIGRSLGCFATSPDNNQKIIDLAKEKKSLRVIVVN